ncbi:hypothetical protein [Bacillus toyonensis]
MNITKGITKVMIKGKELSFLQVKNPNWRDGLTSVISAYTE